MAFALTASLVLATGWITTQLNNDVTVPYMVIDTLAWLPLLAGYARRSALFDRLAALQDEIFHIPQTQKYCAGDWKSWDPKITTFPGLCVPLPRI